MFYIILYFLVNIYVGEDFLLNLNLSYSWHTFNLQDMKKKKKKKTLSSLIQLLIIRGRTNS